MGVKITEQTAMSAPATTDLIESVDVSDTTQASSGTTKKTTFQVLADWLAALTQTLTNKTLTSPTITSPTTTGTDSGAETLVNKTLTAPTIADFTSAAHDHGDADDGGAVVSASATVSGVIEIATAAETTTGTDAARAVSPDGFAGSDYGKRVFGIEVFSPTSAASTGDGKKYVRIPAILNGYNLVGVAAMVVTAGTTNTMDIQIHNLTQTADMLSTKITIDSTETDSATAATAAVIDAANDDVATGDRIRIDIDAVHTTPAQGLVVELTFQLP